MFNMRVAVSSSRKTFGLSCALTTPFPPEWRHRHSADGAACARLPQRRLQQRHGIRDHRRRRVAGDQRTGEDDLRIQGCRHRCAEAPSSAAWRRSSEDAVAQTRLLMEADCRAVLLAPPFYFKNVMMIGLFAWFADLFEKLGSQARDVILYNIPSVTAARGLRSAGRTPPCGVSGSHHRRQGFLRQLGLHARICSRPTPISRS